MIFIKTGDRNVVFVKKISKIDNFKCSIIYKDYIYKDVDFEKEKIKESLFRIKITSVLREDFVLLTDDDGVLELHDFQFSPELNDIKKVLINIYNNSQIFKEQMGAIVDILPKSNNSVSTNSNVHDPVSNQTFIFR